MSNLVVANTIVQQMGGAGKLRAMIGAHTYVGSDTGLQFQFKGCRTANKVQITLGGLDLYKMEIFQLRSGGTEAREVYSEDMLYFDMLIPEFEKATGLCLSL